MRFIKRSATYFSNMMLISVINQNQNYEERVSIINEKYLNKIDELNQRDIIISQLENKIRDLEKTVDRLRDDLSRLKDLEDENCRLKTAAVYNEERIKQLTEDLQQERNNNKTLDFEMFNKKIEEIVEKIKVPGSYNLEEIKKYFDELRRDYIKKSEVEIRINTLTDDLAKADERYKEVCNQNDEFFSERGKFEFERQQLSSEILEYKRKMSDLQQDLQNIQGMFKAKENELKRLQDLYDELMKKGRCEDCVWLKQEIDIYGKLLGLKLSSSESSSSSSSSASSTVCTPTDVDTVDKGFISSSGSGSGRRSSSRITTESVQHQSYSSQQQSYSTIKKSRGAPTQI